MLIIESGINLGTMKKMYSIKIEKLQVDDYTRLEKEDTLIENEIVFFVNQLIFGVKLLRVRTVEIRNFTRIRQKILR